MGDDFSTFPVGNVSLKSRPNMQLKKSAEPISTGTNGREMPNFLLYEGRAV